jgi:hypothetical protein
VAGGKHPGANPTPAPRIGLGRLCGNHAVLSGGMHSVDPGPDGKLDAWQRLGGYF